MDALRKFLGRPEPESAELKAALDGLDRLGRDRRELAPAASTLAVALRAAFAAGPVPTRAESTPIDRRSGELPRFRADPPRLDPARLRARFLAVSSALAGSNPSIRDLGSAAKRRRIDPAAWSSAFFRGGSAGLLEAIEPSELDPEAASSVLRLALLPELSAGSSTLESPTETGPGSGGSCPDCGAPPLLAESRGLERRRRLRCGWCAADWPTPRLACAFCGSADPARRRDRHVSGEGERYSRVDCLDCGFGLRVLSTLGPISAPGLVVADLATIHLDWIDDRDETPA